MDLGTESFIQLRVTSLCRESLELDHRVTCHPVVPSNSDRNTFSTNAIPYIAGIFLCSSNCQCWTQNSRGVAPIQRGRARLPPYSFFVKTKMTTQVMVALEWRLWQKRHSQRQNYLVSVYVIVDHVLTSVNNINDSLIQNSNGKDC